MTRGQRRGHAMIFRVLAVFLLAALGFAVWRRHVVSETEPVAIGRTPLHDMGVP